jgi:hypothetical protein
MPGKPTHARQFFIILAAFLLIAIPRFYFVETFAVTLPFWDQWDAEGDFLLRPWIENRLELYDLWEPHNEHRILPTRILSLLVFQVTKEWNNLAEARVNIILASIVPVTLIWTLFRTRMLTGIRWFVVPVILAQFALPFCFENLLIGFQSQFYFLMLFTLLSIILATYRPDHGATMLIVLTLSVISIFTMGSGLLTPVAVTGIYVLNSLGSRRILRREVIMIFLLLTIAVSGFLLIPNIPNYQGYRSGSISDLMNALGYILSWPVSGHQLPALVLWLPAIITIPLLTIHRKMSRADLVMAGCFIWSLSQGVAIAYGRGQELTEVASRYTELFSLGLISNAWFAIRFFEHCRSQWIRWLPMTFFVILMYGHLTRFSMDMYDMQRNHRYSLIQMKNVCVYLKTSNRVFLQKPRYEIPFPDPARLEELLNVPTIRKILPPPMSKYVDK